MKKYFKYGVMTLCIAIVVLVIVSSFFPEEESETAESLVEEVIEEAPYVPANPMNIDIDSLYLSIHHTTSTKILDKYGKSISLPATTNQYLAYYIPEANLGYVVNAYDKKVLYINFDSTIAGDYIKWRVDEIEKQFNVYDGSHRKLTSGIKSVMNDPRSYEHVKTVYIDASDHLLVEMQYRGTNAFGAKILDNATAKVDMEGNILEML